MDLEQCTPSLSQANRMKRMSQTGNLDMDAMYEVLCEEKPNQKILIKIQADRLDQYFPSNYTDKQKVELIEKLVKSWHEQKVQSPITMLVMMENIQKRIIENAKKGKATWLYLDEFHVLLNREYSAKYLQGLWKKVRKQGEANTDSSKLAEVIGISDAQLRFVTNTSAGMGLIKCGSVVIPFDNTISKDTDLYKLYNTNLHEKIAEQRAKEKMVDLK